MVLLKEKSKNYVTLNIQKSTTLFSSVISYNLLYLCRFNNDTYL